jgi:hypothetical protein
MFNHPSGDRYLGHFHFLPNAAKHICVHISFKFSLLIGGAPDSGDHMVALCLNFLGTVFQRGCTISHLSLLKWTSIQ